MQIRFAIPLRFGVEIEMSGISMQQMRVQVCDVLGVEAPPQAESRWQKQKEVRDAAGRVWEIKPDGHLTEIATPILTNHDDLATLCEIAKALSSAGACTLGAAGLHIHVDAASFLPRDIANLVALMARHQEPLAAALGVRETRAVYCKPIRAELADILHSARHLPDEAFGLLCLRFAGGRDFNLNLTNLLLTHKHTLEFRLFNATLDPNVLVHRVGVVMGLVRAAKSATDFYAEMSRSETPTVAQLAAHIGVALGAKLRPPGSVVRSTTSAYLAHPSATASPA